MYVGNCAEYSEKLVLLSWKGWYISVTNQQLKKIYFCYYMIRIKCKYNAIGYLFINSEKSDALSITSVSQCIEVSST